MVEREIKEVAQRKVPGKPSRLKEIREAKDETVKGLAQALGVSTAYVYKLESGEKRLNEDLLRSAAKFLGVSCDEILGLESRPPGPKNLSYLDATDPGTALNLALRVAQEENWTHDDLRDAIRTLADRWGFFPGGATRPGMAAAS